MIKKRKRIEKEIIKEVKADLKLGRLVRALIYMTC